MPKDLVIGLDSSTTSCKAAVWDADGNLVSLGRSSLDLQIPSPGFHEQDAHSWWTGAVDALRQACQDIDRDRLAGMCITHQRETFVCVDSAGQPLHPAILWMDERSRAQMPMIVSVIRDIPFQQLTGKPLTGNLTFSKLFWLKWNQPAVLDQCHKMVDVQSFLVHKLTGHYRTGWGSADPMGLFDMETAHWAENLLNLVGLQTQQMPDALPPGSFLGNISQAASVETGLPPGMPVVAGIGDGQAAGLGCNIHSPGMAYLSLGTSVISGTYSSGFQTSNAFRTMFGGVPGSFLFETVLLGGTYTISWFIERFLAPFLTGDPNQYLQELEFQAGQIPPGCEGLLLVPYWNSAMNPYWDSSASGIVVGWNGRHTPAHLYRAILEGIAFELRLQIEGVERSLGETIHQLMVMGGGAKSNLWCQVIANITGKSIQRTITPEAAALGAGMIAAGSLGIHPDIASASRAMCKLESQIFVPIPDLHTMYSRLYHDAYLPLFPSIQEPLQHLASITRP